MWLLLFNFHCRVPSLWMFFLLLCLFNPSSFFCLRVICSRQQERKKDVHFRTVVPVKSEKSTTYYRHCTRLHHQHAPFYIREKRKEKREREKEREISPAASRSASHIYTYKLFRKNALSLPQGLPFATLRWKMICN